MCNVCLKIYIYSLGARFALKDSSCKCYKVIKDELFIILLFIYYLLFSEFILIFL